VHPATVVRVGGGGRVQLPYADVLALAGSLELAGDRARGRAGRAGGVAASPHLLASVPFSPVTAAAAEAAVAALGVALAAWSVQIGGDAAAVRRAVHLLTAADDEVHGSLRALEVAAAGCYGRESVPPRVRTTDLREPMSGVAPTGLTALVDHAGQVSALSDDDHPENKGTVEVQTITGGDGHRRHVVYLPGLDDPDPLGADGDVRDAGAAVALEAGVPTAYGAGVVEAMHQAGVRSGEPVLLVGHSLGGMQAAALAAQGTPYDVTEVLTLGSPTVPGDLPPGVGVLSLEHEGDPVPLLDLGASTDSAQHVTVTFDSGTSAAHPMADHGFAHYSAGAAAAEHSTDPVVQHAVTGLDPFLAHPGDTATGIVLQVTRADRAELR
jgi:pimeloyl-ACP methyl ester carboxylesterase